ncbi:MAG: DUF4091 domain-containing protein [Phycisphaerales bacterium]|nr:DUF4091 domain-containing protein [Phycisphaerales bacterium]
MWLAFCASAQEVTTTAVRCVADTCVLATGADDAMANFGANRRLFLGGPGRYALFKFDLDELAGAEIVGAKLRVFRESELLTRVGVSTLAVPWIEGTRDDVRRSESEHPEHPTSDGASFRFARNSGDPEQVMEWAWAGSCFADAVFGNGGSRWASTIASFDKQHRWYEIDVPTTLVQAMVDKLQTPTLCLVDEFGRGEPMIAIASRETDQAPQLIVQSRRTAKVASAPPKNLTASTDWRGLEWLRFDAPTAIGFEIFLSTQEPASQADRSKFETLAAWALPSPGATTRSVMLSAFRGGVHGHVGVRTCDAHGEWSAVVWSALPQRIDHAPTMDVPKLKRYDLPTAVTSSFTMDDGPSISMDGRWMRAEPKTWWHPTEGPIQLEAGANEFVAFQVVLAGGPGTYRVTLADWNSPGAAQPAPRVDYFKTGYVRARMGKDKFAPDPLIPIKAGESLRLELNADMLNSPPTPSTSAPAADAATQPATTQSAPQRVLQTVWIDLYVPRGIAAGTWTTRVIVLRDGATQLDIPLELSVLRSALPDQLSYPIELHSDAPPGMTFLKDEKSDAAWALLNDTHRLAHAHRTTLTMQPYKRDGSLFAGFGPTVVTSGDAPRLDFSEWDEHFGRFLDGSAFRDMPREGQPVTHMMLPFYENWPVLLRTEHAPDRTPLRDRYHYRPTYAEPKSGQPPNPQPTAYLRWPIETAVSKEHGEQSGELLAQFLDHLRDRGWSRPEYYISLSNQPRRGEMSSWWALGAPQVIDDFAALRFFLRPYHDAIGSNRPAAAAVSEAALRKSDGGGKGDAREQIRARIRQNMEDPTTSRGLLDDVVDEWLVGASLSSRNYAIFPRSERSLLWRIEDDVRPEMGLSGIYRWAWDGLLSGATGLVVRQSLGSPESWEKAEDGAFLYPGGPVASREPIASMRLKGLRRAQQDFEWLALWRAADGAKTPEGYYLGVLGQALIERTSAQTIRATTLVPILRLPPALDTVVFEELRRGLRAKAVGIDRR